MTDINRLAAMRGTPGFQTGTLTVTQLPGDNVRLEWSSKRKKLSATYLDIREGAETDM